MTQKDAGGEGAPPTASRLAHPRSVLIARQSFIQSIACPVTVIEAETLVNAFK